MSSESNAVPVSDYASSSEEENLPEATQKNKKIRGKGRLFNYVNTFQDENSIEIEESWKKKVLHTSRYGSKQYFYCSNDRKNCEAEIYLFYNDSNDEVELWENGTHLHLETKEIISLEKIEEMKKLYNSGSKTPNRIKMGLENNNFVAPNLQKISSWMNKYKEDAEGPAVISLAEIRQMVEKHELKEDLAPDQVFMLSKIGYYGKISCDCPRYSKSYTCKHCIYIAVKNKFTKIPDNAKTLDVGEKRSRGRPKLVNKALLR